jgi:hypothetical protein
MSSALRLDALCSSLSKTLSRSGTRRSGQALAEPGEWPMSALSHSVELMTVLRVSCEDRRCFPPVSFQRPEISLFQFAANLRHAARFLGIVLCSGNGSDVPSNTGLVPGNILAPGKGPNAPGNAKMVPRNNSVAKRPRFGCYSQVLNLCLQLPCWDLQIPW